MPSPFARFASTFPSLTGPYNVGTIDVEIPIAELEQPFETPCPDPDITTVSFRLFYPCVSKKDSNNTPAYWIPHPQESHVNYFAKFLGAGETLSKAFQYFPHFLTHIQLSARNNAKPLPHPNNMDGRWPVMIFSHGLAGQRTSYSHICSCMASHGIVVVAPEHRDGSAPVSYIAHGSPEVGEKVRQYVKISHTPSDSVWRARDRQLCIRLWELGLIVEALTQIDNHSALRNICSPKHTPDDALSWFRNFYDIQTPGKVAFAGHSFGACTTLQLLKSVYWSAHENHPRSQVPASLAVPQKILFKPQANAAITSLVTPRTPALLLDMWTLPIRSPFTRYLADLPMPQYEVGNVHGGDSILSVLSSTFAVWAENTSTLKQALQDPFEQAPAAHIATQVLKNPHIGALQQADAASDSGYESEGASTASRSSSPITGRLNKSLLPTSPAHRPAAHIFYPVRSAHSCQSDYGVLFPALTRYLAKGHSPERTIRLNVRAMCEVLRRADIEVAPAIGVSAVDDAILSTRPDMVSGWVCVGADRNGQKAVEQVLESEQMQKTLEDSDGDSIMSTHCMTTAPTTPLGFYDENAGGKSLSVGMHVESA